MKKRTNAPSTKRFIAAIVIAIAIIGIIIYITSAPGGPSYTNSAYGFSFNYPKGYTLSEMDMNTTSSPIVHVITLTPQTTTPPPKDSEGPPVIEAAVYNYSATAATTTLVSWLADVSSTNFTLPNTTYATATLTGNIPAVAYHWSGLYEGESVAIANRNHAIIFSGMYVNPTDKIKSDFESIVSSLQIF